jgi:hypothetical protein
LWLAAAVAVMPEAVAVAPVACSLALELPVPGILSP